MSLAKFSAIRLRRFSNRVVYLEAYLSSPPTEEGGRRLAYVCAFGLLLLLNMRYFQCVTDFEKRLVYLQPTLSRLQPQTPSEQPHHLLLHVVKHFLDSNQSHTTISSSALEPMEVQWTLSGNRC